MTNRWIRSAAVAAAGGVWVWLLIGSRVIVPIQVEAAGACETLSSLSLPGAAVTLAQPQAAGGFVPPDASAAQRAAAARLPAFCRVAATLKPSSDSDIKMEIWMPASNWNGKFQAVGNGAFNGTINYGAMMTALARGYATSSTDTGHTGPGASFALGHPEKVIDFGWRAVHEMTVASKRIITSYYDGGPKFSYWNGCSAGGRQAMKAAQRFPADFDGIIAGAPGLDWTGRAAQALHVAKTLEANEAARLTEVQRRLLHAAVVESCDLADGVKDGVIEDPKRCRFDPGVLECKGSDSVSCLTKPQVETARVIYASAVNPATKRPIPGLARGSELGWTDLGWTASARATGLDQFRFIVFGDPGWTIAKFNFGPDIVRADETDNDTINALDPNLRPFIDRGGKLIQYHGWSDPQISPEASTQYYTRVGETLGGAARVHGSYRLFMAPGMGHCGGGEGPNTFDMVTALEQWVEHGQAPDQIVASRSAGGVERTRPLCPYPQVASYKGTGSTDDAANFVCLLASQAFAADHPDFRLWRADELKKRDAALSKQVGADHSARETLADFGDHRVRFLYRDADGFPEQHDNIVDMVFVQSGEGTLQLGGTVIGKKATGSPGEFVGSRLEGGSRHPLGAGDVIHIPATVPHAFLVPKGKHLTYVLVKFPEQ